MSAGDVLAVVTILISVGKDLHDRIDAMKQAGNDLLMLTIQLELLLKVFEGLEDDVILTGPSDFMRMLGILKSIQESYNRCAKALGVEPAGTAPAAQKTARNGKSFARQVMTFARIPGILAEIRDKAEQLDKMTSILSITFLSDVRKYQRDSRGKESLKQAVVKTNTLPDNLLDLNLRTGFTSIDRIMENLMKECKSLECQLQEATLFPDTSVVQDYEKQNPEGASFWKDRFQNGQLYPSALRYEMFYVSWARFVHEVETTFVLRMMPTGRLVTGDIDQLRSQGSHYSIDQCGTRQLSTIRPLWLPALRSALDPLHKGYVRPQDYFALIHDRSLSETLRKLVFESSGYGTFVECSRASADLALPAAIESPSSHIGWISAQIVAIPTPAELGIVTAQDGVNSSSDAISAYFDGTGGDVYVYVRYLQTGQIERKSLSTQVRPVEGFAIGAALCIRQTLDLASHAWSRDLRIAEFKACQGGEYNITARSGSTSLEFCTSPLKISADDRGHVNDDSSRSVTAKMDYMLLGPSKTFIHPPKVGEKIQIEYDGCWYDSRVTTVDGDEIEFVDWDDSSKKGDTSDVETSDSDGPNETDEDEDDLFFHEGLLTQLGKGTRRLWGPWRRNVDTYNVRPYRRFHIDDTVEAPVIYPDFRFQYHNINDSQLYLPARIVDVQGDQYMIEFSPSLLVHSWWPGRMLQGEEIDMRPGSDIKLKNPFDLNRVAVAMDLVRPFVDGPRPTLGVQSAKPPGWSSFQGIQLYELEDLLERSLWTEDHDVKRADG